MTDGEINQLTERIIGCGIEVHRTVGAGLLESVYRDCMLIELQHAGLRVSGERSVRLNYRGVPVNAHLRIDALVEDRIVLELKATDGFQPIWTAQVVTYLKLLDCPVGLIMNFNVPTLKSGIRRVEHPERYVRRLVPLASFAREKVDCAEERDGMKH